MKYMKENGNTDDISIIPHYRFFMINEGSKEKAKQGRLKHIFLPPLFFPPVFSSLSENTLLSCFTLSWPAVLNEYINTDE